MFGMIFNLTNAMILLIVLMICYQYWKPYIRSKKAAAVVDGYCHPVDGSSDSDKKWCCRFVYREQKAGKRLYCYSRKTYDTREEARSKWAKGTEVTIRYYDDGNNVIKAVVEGDTEDKKQYGLYTFAVLVGATGVAVAYQFLSRSIGQ